jgi:diaminohydroxyphosphoribosylaminopyrimidine deaminase/5-amino-6-(5-phosphoribosylamino)uracil reductase
MPEFTSTDHEFMAQALRLARRGLFTAHPNPRVGCVLVNSGAVVAEGWHRLTGEPHAEINALAMAGDRTRGCTAYITLEPCSHHGKTPPCADALIDAGVTRVVAAMDDPDPRVAGSGFDRLRKAGVEVSVGLMHSVARSLNEGFVSRLERGRPFLRLKIAASLDGRTAMANGESQWITGEPARRDGQRLRAASGAIMTGVATVLADDSSLTVRDPSIENEGLQPVRVVLDSRLRMPATAGMLKLPGKTVIFCVDDRNRQALEDAGAEIRQVTAVAGQVDLVAVMPALADLEINDVLVEAGPVLAGNLLAAGMVDELVIYQAPHMMGSETRGMILTPAWQSLQQRQALEIVDVRMLGQDIRMTARPAE